MTSKLVIAHSDHRVDTTVTRFLLLILFIATIGGRVLGLDLGLAPGLSIKNALLYIAVCHSN